MYTIEKFNGKKSRKIYVRIRASNRNILFTSQAYATDPEEMIKNLISSFKPGKVVFKDLTVQ